MAKPADLRGEESAEAMAKAAGSGARADECTLTAAAGGSQTIRFERFIFQASGSAGGIDIHRCPAYHQIARTRPRRRPASRPFFGA